MKKISLISVITVFGFINSYAQCNWVNACDDDYWDWNNDSYGGYGEYWDSPWYDGQTHKNSIRNFLAAGCQVTRANYQMANVYGRDGTNDTHLVEKQTIFPRMQDQAHYLVDYEGCPWLIYCRLSVQEGWGWVDDLADETGYPWHQDNIPGTAPYPDVGLYRPRQPALAVRMWPDGTKEYTIRGCKADHSDVSSFPRSEYWWFGNKGWMYEQRSSSTWRMILIIEEGITRIPRVAFQHHRVVDIRNFPNSCTEIGNGAFRFCPLRRIHIGENVNHVGQEAFADLGNYPRVVHCRAKNPPSTGWHVFDNSNVHHIPLQVPEGSISKYRAHHEWGQFHRIEDQYGSTLDPVTAVYLDITAATLKRSDPHVQLKHSVTPAISDPAVTWSSSDTEIASVDAAGKVTFVSMGTATITAESLKGNKTASCTVTCLGDTISTINAFTLKGFNENTYSDTLNTPILLSYFDSVPTLTISSDNEWAKPRYELASPLNVGENALVITGIAEDPDYTTPYEYSIIRNPLIMQNISLSSGEMFYPFAPERREYAIQLDDSIESITYTAECNDPLGIVMNTGTHYYDYGMNKPDTIWIKGPDNETTRYQPYVFTVYRNYNSDASLKSLKLNIPIEFDKNIREYSAEVEFEIASINIEVETTHQLATVSGHLGQQPLEAGDNTLHINVTAHNGSAKRTYTLKVKRKKDSDATLRSLTVDTFSLNPSFSPATLKYTVNIPNEVSRVSIKAEGNGYVSYISGTGKILLNVGLQQAQVTVHAMDGSRKVYRLNITRAAPPQPDLSAGLSAIEQDLPVDVFTLTGIYLGRYEISNLRNIKRHKVVIVKNGNNVFKIKI